VIDNFVLESGAIVTRTVGQGMHDSYGTVNVPDLPSVSDEEVFLPGVSLHTEEADVCPQLDVASLEPDIVKHERRWELQAKVLMLEQEAALLWACESFSPPAPSDHSIRSFCTSDGCDYIRPLPSALRPAHLRARLSILSFFLALRSADQDKAFAYIHKHALARSKWTSARLRPAPVSPTPSRWYEGQLAHLSDQAPTPEGELRRKQIERLIASDGVRPQTASLPPTTPSQDRSVWAGFPASRALHLSSIGLLARSFEPLSNNFTVDWSFDINHGGHTYGTPASVLTVPDVLLVGAYSSRRTSLANIFASTADVFVSRYSREPFPNPETKAPKPSAPIPSACCSDILSTHSTSERWYVSVARMPPGPI
jgi:hypothetical protein